MNFSFPTLNAEFYLAAMPILLLCAGSIVLMLQAVLGGLGRPHAVFGVLMVTLLSALGFAIAQRSSTETSFLLGSYLSGALASFAHILILVVGIVITLLFFESHQKCQFLRGEIASLYLMILAGMLTMVASEELITLFVGLELSSIGLYAVVGYLAPSRRSQEGAIKYFTLGSFAAALLLFGFALLYAATGSMRLTDIIDAAAKLSDHPWVKLGILFTMCGLAFKLALAPFHLWAPDTYEAAPTGITALMATTVKTMVLVVTLRVVAGDMTQNYEVWLPGLMFVAVLSMLAGNIMALVQTSLKRMLAYSSIAHSGYLAVAICAIAGSGNELPVSAILFYLVGYSIISLGAFAVLMWLESEHNDNLLLDDLAGLGKKHPWLAFALASFMFAFAGMPPTVGFMSKFFVFNAALTNKLYALVIIGVIGSTISMFYYLRVIVRMYMDEPSSMSNAGLPQAAPRGSMVTAMILGVAVVLTLLLGTVLSGPSLALLRGASQGIVSH